MKPVTLTLIQVATLKANLKFTNIRAIAENEDYTIVYLYEPMGDVDVEFDTPVLSTHFSTIDGNRIMLISNPAKGFDDSVTLPILMLLSSEKRSLPIRQK